MCGADEDYPTIPLAELLRWEREIRASIEDPPEVPECLRGPKYLSEHEKSDQ